MIFNDVINEVINEVKNEIDQLKTEYKNCLMILTAKYHIPFNNYFRELPIMDDITNAFIPTTIYNRHIGEEKPKQKYISYYDKREKHIIHFKNEKWLLDFKNKKKEILITIKINKMNKTNSNNINQTEISKITKNLYIMNFDDILSLINIDNLYNNIQEAILKILEILKIKKNVNEITAEELGKTLTSKFEIKFTDQKGIDISNLICTYELKEAKLLHTQYNNFLKELYKKNLNQYTNILIQILDSKEENEQLNQIKKIILQNKIYHFAKSDTTKTINNLIQEGEKRMCITTELQGKIHEFIEKNFDINDILETTYNISEEIKTDIANRLSKPYNNIQITNKEQFTNYIILVFEIYLNDQNKKKHITIVDQYLQKYKKLNQKIEQLAEIININELGKEQFVKTIREIDFYYINYVINTYLQTINYTSYEKIYDIHRIYTIYNNMKLHTKKIIQDISHNMNIYNLSNNILISSYIEEYKQLKSINEIQCEFFSLPIENIFQITRYKDKITDFLSKHSEKNNQTDYGTIKSELQEELKKVNKIYAIMNDKDFILINKDKYDELKYATTFSNNIKDLKILDAEQIISKQIEEDKIKNIQSQLNTEITEKSEICTTRYNYKTSKYEHYKPIVIEAQKFIKFLKSKNIDNLQEYFTNNKKHYDIREKINDLAPLEKHQTPLTIQQTIQQIRQQIIQKLIQTRIDRKLYSPSRKYEDDTLAIINDLALLEKHEKPLIIHIIQMRIHKLLSVQSEDNTLMEDLMTIVNDREESNNEEELECLKNLKTIINKTDENIQTLQQELSKSLANKKIINSVKKTILQIFRLYIHHRETILDNKQTNETEEARPLSTPQYHQYLLDEIDYQINNIQKNLENKNNLKEQIKQQYEYYKKFAENIDALIEIHEEYLEICYQHYQDAEPLCTYEDLILSCNQQKSSEYLEYINERINKINMLIEITDTFNTKINYIHKTIRNIFDNDEIFQTIQYMEGIRDKLVETQHYLQKYFNNVFITDDAENSKLEEDSIEIFFKISPYNSTLMSVYSLPPISSLLFALKLLPYDTYNKIQSAIEIIKLEEKGNKGFTNKRIIYNDYIDETLRKQKYYPSYDCCDSYSEFIKYCLNNKIRIYREYPNVKYFYFRHKELVENEMTLMNKITQKYEKWKKKLIESMLDTSVKINPKQYKYKEEIAAGDTVLNEWIETQEDQETYFQDILKTLKRQKILSQDFFEAYQKEFCIQKNQHRINQLKTNFIIREINNAIYDEENFTGHNEYTDNDPKKIDVNKLLETLEGEINALILLKKIENTDCIGYNPLKYLMRFVRTFTTFVEQNELYKLNEMLNETEELKELKEFGESKKEKELREKEERRVKEQQEEERRIKEQQERRIKEQQERRIKEAQEAEQRKIKEAQEAEQRKIKEAQEMKEQERRIKEEQERKIKEEQEQQERKIKEEQKMKEQEKAKNGKNKNKKYKEKTQSYNSETQNYNNSYNNYNYAQNAQNYNYDYNNSEIQNYNNNYNNYNYAQNYNYDYNYTQNAQNYNYDYNNFEAQNYNNNNNYNDYERYEKNEKYDNKYEEEKPKKYEEEKRQNQNNYKR